MADDIVSPQPKKARRLCHFDSRWVQEFQGIGKSSKGYTIIAYTIASYY